MILFIICFSFIWWLLTRIENAADSDASFDC